MPKGKYLNVICECGLPIDGSASTTISYTKDERYYQEIIELAYNFASNKLLDLLMKEKQLLQRLRQEKLLSVFAYLIRSIKHYFLLDQGDFFVHFMDIAGEELRKQVQGTYNYMPYKWNINFYSDITLSKLNSLLELSLRTSVADADSFKDDLTCELLPYNLLHQLLKIIHVADGTVHVNASQIKSNLSPNSSSTTMNTSSVPNTSTKSDNNSGNSSRASMEQPTLTGLNIYSPLHIKSHQKAWRLLLSIIKFHGHYRWY
jgi:hypothetical protein